MTEILSWNYCLRKHIKKIPPDFERAKALVEISTCRLEMIPSPNEKNTFILIEQYYEIIKELLIALMNLDGFKSNNHECLVAYFKNYFEYSFETNLIYTLKFLRNKIQYEGKIPNRFFLENNLEDIKSIISLLQRIYLEKINKT